MFPNPEDSDRKSREQQLDRKADHDKHDNPTPWVSAEECQPKVRVINPLDDVDEALLESFPCSDPPCFSHTHI